MTEPDLLEKYVLLHNLGIETGDFGPVLDLFADDAVFEFEDPRIGVFEGIEMIAGIFRRNPPEVRIVISDIRRDSGSITADYADGDAQPVRLGKITLESDGVRIKRLYIGK